MALGIQTESGGGNFTPTVKINSKQGRVYRVDRKQTADGFSNEEVEITRDFSFVPDLPNLEIGWMYFKAGQAPDLRMVKLGEVMADRPAGADAEGKPLFKQGVRLLVKLGEASGGDLREIAATAKSILGPIDKLHDDYLAAPEAKAGQLPVVKMLDMKKVDLKTAHGTNTNFEPVFVIDRWVDREAVFGAAALAQAAPETPKQETKSSPAMATATGDKF